MHDPDAAPPGKLLRLAREINQQIAVPYTLALLGALFGAVGAGILAARAPWPWTAAPLLAFAAFVGTLALLRGLLLRPWLRGIERRLRARLDDAGHSGVALRTVCDDDPDLRLLARALRRWEFE